MVMTKKASFGALLYREAQIVKKQLLLAAVTFGITALIGVLVLMSMKYGNIAKLPEGVRVAADGFMRLIVFYLPVFSAGVFVMASAESSARDELPLWKRFRKASPVKPWKFSLAKTLVLALCVLGSAAVSVVYLLIMRAIDGGSFSKEDLGVVLFITAALTLISVLFEIYIMLLHTADKAGLALVGTAFAVFFPYSIITGLNNAQNPQNRQTDASSSFDKLIGFCEDFIPFSILIIIAAGAIGFFVCAALIKRGEK